MSGHSKWATIKRKKGKTDAARGKVFSKLIKEITIAARMGGGDESSNPRLRTAILLAKGSNMPATNIERAIKKGTGDLPGVNYEEVTYEAYGPGGTAFLLEVFTDSRNRTVSEVRHLIGKNNGNMAEAGAVSWMFSRVGQIGIPAEGIDEDEVMMAALEAGADDVKHEEDYFVVTMAPELLEDVREGITKEGFTIETAEIAMVPQTEVRVEGSLGKQNIRLFDLLEDHDDIQQVWTNADIDEALYEEEE
ncbi:MAG: YebC/PmpR family DNA-binding transcriptional regulator [Calditrichaeota bacterium]|jgi:YebC/PmpR family DNA-binding regulatory protein|nr:YebC/PmpR family DNA-binding transcriptional regulator [Calditrichota bacterium]MBT7618865.1 YebC/PmpR family DNA-binding transcriptional regulator [Calditrichota bacterium]MBT7787864.1 YebC/PmpR family DNA-binding transcriptional regulator [Calditrichota bacterium]